MALNKGYLTASTNRESDEKYTPFYAVEPLLQYLDKTKTIWCPFDTDQSAFVVLLKERGYKVIHSHIFDGKDFFEYEPKHYDIIISNPPFSLKDQVIERVYKLNKPFALLLPTNTLQGQKRFDYFKQGLQLLSFDKRINYHNPKSMVTTVKGVAFSSSYFCKDLLPSNLELQVLKPYERALKDD